MTNNEACEHLVERVTLSGVEVWAFRLEDSPSGHPLQLRARITGLAGFTLLSLTRNTGCDPSGVVRHGDVLFLRLRPLQGRNRARNDQLKDMTPSGSPDAARCLTRRTAGSQRLELRQEVRSDPEVVAGNNFLTYGFLIPKGSQPVARPAQQAFDPEGVVAGVQGICCFGKLAAFAGRM